MSAAGTATLILGVAIFLAILLVGYMTRKSSGDHDQMLAEIKYELDYNGGGSVKDMVKSLHNIQVEEQLAAQKAAFRLEVVSEAVNVPLFETDKDANVIWCNNAYIAFWGFTSMEDAMTDRWIEQLTPAGRELAVTRMTAIMRSKSAFRYTNTLKTGELIEFVGEPIYLDGKFNGWTGSVRLADDHIVHSTDA